MTEPITDKTPKISAKRPKIRLDSISYSEHQIAEMLRKRITEKGDGAWVSRHEILGIVSEEYFELGDAVTSKPLNNVKDELIDIAVACLFGIACIDQGELHW